MLWLLMLLLLSSIKIVINNQLTKQEQTALLSMVCATTLRKCDAGRQLAPEFFLQPGSSLLPAMACVGYVILTLMPVEGRHEKESSVSEFVVLLLLLLLLLFLLLSSSST